MWKETLVALLRVYIQIYLEGMRNSKQQIQAHYITHIVVFIGFSLFYGEQFLL
jgi:hypothetical protein